MREILFRGKSVNGTGWFEGSLRIVTIQPADNEAFKQYEIEDTTLGVFPNDFMSGFCETVVPETVGQFTGLYDSTKWEDLTEAEKLDFYKQHYIGNDGMSVRFQHIDDVKHLWKGKKIFEGDILSSLDDEVDFIVAFNNGCFNGVSYATKGAMMEYGWDECAGGYGVIECEPLDSYHPEKYHEVIGNIHDNPELLNGGS